MELLDKCVIKKEGKMELSDKSEKVENEIKIHLLNKC